MRPGWGVPRPKGTCGLSLGMGEVGPNGEAPSMRGSLGSCVVVVGVLLRLFISCDSGSSSTFRDPAPSQLGICGSESSPPGFFVSNSAYWGGPVTPVVAGTMTG